MAQKREVSSMWETITMIVPYAIAYTIPLLITSLGGLFSERSGVVNIGMEGMMLMGNFVAAYSIMQLHTGIWAGLLLGAMAGGIFAILHAFAAISLNANQIISGTAINMIAAATTLFVARYLTGSGNITIHMGFAKTDIPLLSDIPVIGPLFFHNTYPTTFVVLFILVASWYLIYKTAFGMRLRACGEHPQAADAAGINVYVIRYIAVIISGALSGLGGAVILVTYSGEFNGSVAGLGFLALAALIFGQWKPKGILMATLFFGTAATIANIAPVTPSLAWIPAVILKTFPYIVTIIALVIFSKTSAAPKAAGEPFDKGKR